MIGAASSARRVPASVAALASLVLPGSGQLLLGSWARGLGLLLGLPIQAWLLLAAGQPGMLPWLAVVWLWNAADAWMLGTGGRLTPLVPALILVWVNMAVGSRLTGVDWAALGRGWHRAVPIARGLANPAVLEPNVREVGVSTVFAAPGPGVDTKNVGLEEEGGRRVIIEPAILPPRTPARVTGTGFPPNAEGRLVLVATGERTLEEFRTDASGSFSATVEHTLATSGRYWIDARVGVPQGGWRVTQTFRRFVELMVETLYLALVGTMLSLVVALPLSFMGAQNLARGSAAGLAGYTVVRGAMNIVRSVEVIIIALMMVRAVGIGAFAGVLAIGIHGIGALGKLYSEAIEGIDAGPIEAITATGASRFQVIMQGVVPQVVPPFVAFTVYRWDINVRMATIIGFVGGGGIGFELKNVIDLGLWSQVGAAIWLIALVVVVLDYGSAVVRRHLT